MASAEVHGEIIVEVENEFTDERKALVHRWVRLMEDGTILARTHKKGDRNDPSTWIPTGRVGGMLNSEWDSGWKRPISYRLPPHGRTREVAEFILDDPDRIKDCLSAGDVVQRARDWHYDRLSASRRKPALNQEDDGADSHVIAETQSDNIGPEPQDRYANVGLSRSKAKVKAAKFNGRKGGRPPKWSPDVRAVAAELLRTRAGGRRTRPELAEELLRLAQALEDGAYR